MGYEKATREEYWEEVKNALSKNGEKDMIIWTTGNIGQIAKMNQNQENNKTEENTPEKIGIGERCLAKTSENGSGRSWEIDTQL